jgi:hypothetical protein
MLYNSLQVSATIPSQVGTYNIRVIGTIKNPLG